MIFKEILTIFLLHLWVVQLQQKNR